MQYPNFRIFPHHKDTGKCSACLHYDVGFLKGVIGLSQTKVQQLSHIASTNIDRDINKFTCPKRFVIMPENMERNKSVDNDVNGQSTGTSG
jgi:hypothetical protein